MPTRLQSLACNLVALRTEQRRYGGSFRSILQAVEDRSGWRQEQVVEFRDYRLREFLRYTVEWSPYYRSRLGKLGVSVSDSKSMADLIRQLPILRKRDIQNCSDALKPKNLAVSSKLVVHTSGTTGSGLKFWTTRLAMQEQWAVWWRYRRWHGIDLNMWCGYFGGRVMASPSQLGPPFWRVNYPAKQIMFSGNHMTPANLPGYIKELRRQRPPWLHGYPSLLALLASYLLDRRMDLGYTPKWVTSGAENLLPNQADLIYRGLGVRPRQHYGMAEAVANFSECEQGRLHVDEDFAAVEFVPTGDSECTYRVVGTNFSNPLTPLVRYDVDDIVTLFPGNCSCGRPGRIVERVDGRTSDYVVLRHGRVLGPVNHLFKWTTTVLQAQLHQSVPGEVTIRIVRGEGYSESDQERILCEVGRRLGPGNQVSLEYVDEIQRSASGKYRAVISEIIGRETNVSDCSASNQVAQ